jgi:hypothetical protein
MRYLFFPAKDAAVYETAPDTNTGLDEILEVGKTDDGRKIVRSLLQFDLSNTIVPLSASYDLVLYIANADRLKAMQGVVVCPLSQSWEEGTGYFYQTIKTSDDGATWTQNISGSFWASGSAGGSTINLFASSSINVIDGLVSVDVTPLVTAWISGSDNNGLMVRFPVSDELDNTNQGNVKFFSNNSHTIYKPTLVARWNDQVYTTGSQAWPTSSLTVIPSTLAAAYRTNELVRVDLAVREKYPVKTFVSSSLLYSGDHFLPSSSYFSIVDEQSGTTLIPFGDDSRVHTVANTSYFTFRIQNMYPRRYYRVIIKVDHNGYSEVFDNNSIFTVR